MTDPETPLSDAEHRLGEVQRMAQSMAQSRDATVRACGRKILAAGGWAVPDGQERSEEKEAGNGGR
jgi:hypothetical protein